MEDSGEEGQQQQQQDDTGPKIPAGAVNVMMMGGLGPNMLGELKNRQKEKGIQRVGSSSNEAATTSSEDAAPPPQRREIVIPPRQAQPPAQSSMDSDLQAKLNRRRQMADSGEVSSSPSRPAVTSSAAPISSSSEPRKTSAEKPLAPPARPPATVTAPPRPTAVATSKPATSSLSPEPRPVTASSTAPPKRSIPSMAAQESSYSKPAATTASPKRTTSNEASPKAASSSTSPVKKSSAAAPATKARPLDSEVSQPSAKKVTTKATASPAPAVAKPKGLARAKSSRKAVFPSGTTVATPSAALSASSEYKQAGFKGNKDLHPRSEKIPARVLELANEVPPPPRKKTPPPPYNPRDDWETLQTAEGEPYYSNKVTGETTWVKPPELYGEEELANLKGDWVWAAHKEFSWVPAKIKSKLSNGALEVILMGEGCEEDVEPKTILAKEVGPPIKLPQSLHNLTSDLVQLDDVHEPAIIDLLRRRYRRDKIYTNVGDILVAVNPFKATSLFTPTMMQQYATVSREAMELPPHPYAVINASYQDLMEYGQDQSLLISGESGAGKTVTVKVCLEFLSEIAGGDDAVEQKILASNPILEAFGNAKTVRNDNSSRFGKFMEIHFDTKGSRHIVGCNTVNYLLEKSRVVAPARGERNFHIFIYMLTQFPDSEQKEFLLFGRKPESFKYLSPDGKPVADAETHDDADECSKMRKAFLEMGVSQQESNNVYRATAAVLHLGNVEFEDSGSTGSKVTSASMESLKNFANLLSLDVNKLADSLTKHESMQRDGLLTRAFNPAVAADARNALARHLYGRLFQYLVNRVNLAMADGPNAKMMLNGAGSTNYIGMLDIFGFEIFEVNSFEQLCINFANEKLQQMFNRHTFTLEEKTYESQGIEFDRIEFHDSQPLLTFLGLAAPGEKIVRDGVFQLLDEQTVIGSGTDDKFLQSIISRHKDKKSLFSDACKSRSAFKIYHYAGGVEYDSTNFITKNADKLYENITSVMQSSKIPFISSVLFAESVGVTSAESPNGVSAPAILSTSADSPTHRPMHKTQASVFTQQLQKLEERTNATFPRYIRCVKPNQFKRPRLFDSPSSLQQLRFAGVFEAVAIRKKGFPFRHTHRHFYETFRSIVPKAVSWAEWKAAREQEELSKGAFLKLAKTVHEALVKGPIPEAKDCRFGKTMVLFRAAQHRALEIGRLTAINAAASLIQKVAKGRHIRRHMPELRATRAECNAAIKSRDPSALDQAIATGNMCFFKIKQVYDAEAVRDAIKQEKSLLPTLQKLLAQDTRSDQSFTQVEDAVYEIAKYGKRDPLAFSTVPEAKRLRDLYSVLVDQRDARGHLKEAIASVPRAPAIESCDFLASACGNAMDVAKSCGGDGSFFVTEFEEAAGLLNHLTTEIALAEECMANASASEILGEQKHKQPGQVDIQSRCTPNIKSFRESVESLRRHSPLAPDVKQSLIRFDVLVRLREATLVALSLGEGAQADEPEWRAVESLLRELAGKTVSNEQQEEDATSSPQALLFNPSSGEIAIIGNDLALRAAVDDVLKKLKDAIMDVDDEELSVALQQANALQMHDHPDDSIRSVVNKADDLLPRVQHARHALDDALREVDENLLANALKAQSACGYGAEPGMVGHNTVLEARQLFAWVLDLTAQAQVGVRVLEPKAVANIVAGCNEIRLEIPELEILREFLALSPEVQLLRQRDAAIATGNYRRAVRLGVEHKDLIFGKGNARDDYALQHFAKLKTPEEYAKRFGIKWSRYQNTMLSHYNPMFGKIHTSLTTIECSSEEETKQMNKLALTLSKNIFGIMGDKSYENVDALLYELLNECLQHPILRDEIYCQIMKQLTKNPNPDSESKGWNLMAICLSVFPPGQQLEMYLENFLRNHNRSELVEKLHQIQLGGPLQSVPTVESLASIRQPNNTTFWMYGKRTQITFEESMWQNKEVVDQEVIDWREATFVPGSEIGERTIERKRRSLEQPRGSAPVRQGSMKRVGAPPPKPAGASALSSTSSSGSRAPAPPPPNPMHSDEVAPKAAAPPPPVKRAAAPPPRRSSQAGGPPPPRPPAQHHESEDF